MARRIEAGLKLSRNNGQRYAFNLLFVFVSLSHLCGFHRSAARPGKEGLHAIATAFDGPMAKT
ncbi:hypothetical protein PGTUg99_019499, partial [Puccinia graminis f. sp. tritici]